MPTQLAIGDRVRLVTAPPFFKTADPMPMLRPPDLVAVGAEGDVTEQRSGGYWVVKFERGSFLLDAQYLAPAEAEGTANSEPNHSGPNHSDPNHSGPNHSEPNHSGPNTAAESADHHPQ